MAAAETRYSENRPRIVLGLEFLFLAIIFASGIGLHQVGLQIAAGFLLGVMLVLAWRAFQSATLVIQGDFIVAHSLLRNTRLKVQDLTGVRLVKGTVGIYERSYLAFDLVDGRHIAFKSLNSNPREDGSAAQQAAYDIAKRIGVPLA